MPSPSKVWIVDDEPLVRSTLSRVLTKAGYETVECDDGVTALERLESDSPDLVLLDVDMPRLNGWKTLAELRRRDCHRPVLMFTQVDDVDSKVRGLGEGADDYMSKASDPRELLARVAALLRRSTQAKEKPDLFRFGNLRIDLENKTATKGGVPLKLTRTDFALLKLLRGHPGRPVSREEILQTVWGGRAGNSHALDTHLWRLRKKLGDTGGDRQLIHNLSGIGYVMELGD